MMKRTPRQYAKAFAATLDLVPKGKEEAACRALIRLAKKNGDARELDAIVREAERIFARKKGGQSVLVESARATTPKSRRELFRRFGENDVVREKIFPELVAGVRITIDGERELDMSLSGRLSRLL
ncbi:MAG: F0F1 ATP synthase subunit delta [Patescibacteria group bacterium]